MNGPAVARSVLIAAPGVTALVPASRIIADEVVAGDIALPFVLIKLVSGVDLNPLTPAATVFVRQRVQVEIHAVDQPSRAAIKKAVRSACLSSPHPTVAGLSNVTLHTEGEGPDFTVGATFVRVAEQDLFVTYSETI